MKEYNKVIYYQNKQINNLLILIINNKTLLSNLKSSLKNKMKIYNKIIIMI